MSTRSASGCNRTGTTASTRSSVRPDPAGWCWAARPTREPTEELEWNATLVEGDLEDAIPKLKHEVDGDLFIHGSGELAFALAEKGLIDKYEIYLNPLVWGQGNVHVLGDRGTVRLSLDDVKRFESGVVLLTYLPAS